MSDPVAAKSAFLCAYMTNDHPDTLVAYVKHFGKIPGNVTTAKMESVDSNGMSLSYALKRGGGGFTHVKFNPPLASYDELRPRLLAMKDDAEEALKKLQSLKITSFHLPRNSVIFLYWLLGTAYFTWAPPQGTSVPFIPTDVSDAVFAPAHTVLSAIGFQPSMTQALQIYGVIHSIESVYTWYLCSRHVKGLAVKATYIFATVIFGFPIWTDLKKRIEEKQIEGVAKAE